MEKKDEKQEKNNQNEEKNGKKSNETNNSDDNKEKIEIKESPPSKEISEFISILNQTTTSLPNFLNSIQKYFSSLENKILNLIQQINNFFNTNSNIINNDININNKQDEQIDNNIIKDDLFTNIEQNCQINKYIDIFNKYQKLLFDKNEELTNMLKETIINQIKKELNQFKIEKNKILYKFQNLINEILQLKKNIDLIKNKNNEDLKIENNNEIKILQEYLIHFEKEYNIIILEIKKINDNINSFISENLNKYFEITSKIQDEINKERIKNLNNLKKSKTNEDNLFYKTISKNNENIFKNIKTFNSIKLESENDEETKEKKKTLFSRMGEVFLLENDYFMLMNNFENEIETNIRNKKDNDEGTYNKEDLSLLKKVFNELKKPEVVSDDLLHNCFTILGNNSNNKNYINLCFNFVKYANSCSLANKENNNNFKYYNFDNFIFSNNLFNIISQNCQRNNIISTDKKQEFKENYKFYQILDNIINIGEQSFIDNKYMCSLLKDNNHFINDIKIWELHL